MKTNQELNVLNAASEALNDQPAPLSEKDLALASGGVRPKPTYYDEPEPISLPDGKVITGDEPLPVGKILIDRNP